MAGEPFWSNGTNVAGLALSSDGQITGGNQVYMKNPLDTAWFAGVQIPGRVTLDPGGGVFLLLDKVKAKAMPGGGGLSRSLDVDGASLRILGLDPKEFSFTVLIWTSAQDSAWQAFVDAVWKRPKKAARIPQGAAEVRQTLLNRLGINQAALIDITYAGPGAEHPSTQWRLKFQHSVRPVPRKHQTVKGADSGLKKTDKLPQLEAPSTNAANATLLGPKAKPAGGL